MLASHGLDLGNQRGDIESFIRQKLCIVLKADLVKVKNLEKLQLLNRKVHVDFARGMVGLVRYQSAEKLIGLYDELVTKLAGHLCQLLQ